MFLRVVCIVYLFLIRCRFPSNKSVAEIVRKRYGNDTLVQVRKLEKLNFRHGKTLLDISFLEVCLENDLSPKFVSFRTANFHLKRTETYKECQRLLIQQELRSHCERLKEITRQMTSIKKLLKGMLILIDFLYITSLFFEKNHKSLEIIKNKQNLKLCRRSRENPKHQANDIIHNFSDHVLTEAQKSVLMKGLNFCIPPGRLKAENYFLDFELLFRKIKFGEKCEERHLEELKTALKNTAYSSLKFHNRKKQKLENITEEEYKALSELSSLENVIIQKADKGNMVVLLNKSSYFQKMESILGDTSKFSAKNFTGAHEDLKFILKKEIEINEFLSKLLDRNIITSKEFSKMCPKGSSPGIFYGLCKVHKGVTSGDCPPFRPILSAINTPSYQIAKYLVPLLSPITSNAFTCTDSFSFASDVRNQNSEFHMASFDVESLFTNIPLDETINICIKKLFGEKTKFKGFTKNEFRKLMQFAVKDSLILFNGKYYIQNDGVAMGSPLGPHLANIFLCHNEEKWLSNCPPQFAPIYYKRYVDDTFLLFSSPKHVKKFHKYFNSRHPNIKFTFELEENNQMPFLDVLVSRISGKFNTSIYRKPTFSGLYTNFESFIPECYKKGLVYCLLYRIFTLTTTWKSFDNEVQFLKTLFLKNGYPQFFIDRCIKKFLNKHIALPAKTNQVECENLTISLPFLGKHSNNIKKKILEISSKFLANTKVSVVWKSKSKISNLFKFKDLLPVHLCSKVLYKFTCNGCNSIYLGKTKRHFHVRACEHLGISFRTGNNLTYNPKNKNNTAVLDHIHKSQGCQNCDLSSIKIIGGADNDFNLKIKESLIIQKLKPTLINKTSKSIPLYLFG